MNGVIAHVTQSTDGNPGLLDWVTSTTDGFSTTLAAAVFSLVMFGLLFSALKGKYGFVLLAVLVPGLGSILSVIGGVRLAKPRSFWARHMYDRSTMAEAIERHEPKINLENYPRPKLRKGYENSEGGARPSAG